MFENQTKHRAESFLLLTSPGWNFQCLYTCCHTSLWCQGLLDSLWVHFYITAASQEPQSLEVSKKQLSMCLTFIFFINGQKWWVQTQHHTNIKYLEGQHLPQERLDSSLLLLFAHHLLFEHRILKNEKSFWPSKWKPFNKSSENFTFTHETDNQFLFHPSDHKSTTQFSSVCTVGQLDCEKSWD